MGPLAGAAAESLTGRSAGLLSGVEEALPFAAVELALAPAVPRLPVKKSTPQRFHTAIRSRSSDVKDAAFFMRRCFFLFRPPVCIVHMRHQLAGECAITLMTVSRIRPPVDVTRYWLAS